MPLTAGQDKSHLRSVAVGFAALRRRILDPSTSRSYVISSKFLSPQSELKSPDYDGLPLTTPENVGSQEAKPFGRTANVAN
jgi:hypothetical protein